MKKFSLDIQNRSTHIIVTIGEYVPSLNEYGGIGSIALTIEDADLLPYIHEMINKFNAKHTEPPIQTTTGTSSKTG